MYPIRSAESTEFLRLQAALARDASPSPVPTPPPKRSPLSESEETRVGSGVRMSEREKLDEIRREERWQASRRVEVGGMI